MSSPRCRGRLFRFASRGVFGLALGISVAGSSAILLGQESRPKPPIGGEPGYAGADTDSTARRHLLQSPGASVENRAPSDYGLGDHAATRLPRYPDGNAGDRTPFDLHIYAGRGKSSFGSATLEMPWAEWVDMCAAQRPSLTADRKAYMESRFDFSNRAIEGAAMSGGKPVMKGPIARLPQGVASFEELGALAASDIAKRDLFPYKPLSHMLQTTAHMVFPENWVKTHPEHERFDCEHDIPESYLPEFPPPLFLTTHKELGDVTSGREITLSNYFAIFDGLLTGEQMEGLKELLRPTATTWFNHTEHRVTLEPSAGVACFSCHVNGHTNGAIELAPDSRPNEARLRVDTPTLRGNFNLMQLSSKRSIRSLDHFSEVEEYFDGDPGSLGQPIGLANRQRSLTNRMGDFNAIIDNPPAPKLGPLMTLDKAKATPSELRGEELFHGKAKCSECHHGPAFVDDYMHDLQVERFYAGRPEGPIKTFPLRGIKDTPPYLHDGRCPTLHDAVEFFDLILELGLTRPEKEDLVAFLLCL